MSLLAKCVFAALLLAVTASVAGPIYTWQDKDGRVHYADRPLGNGEPVHETKLDTRLPAAADLKRQPAGNGYSIQEQMEYFDRRRAERRQAWLERQRLRQAAEAQKLQARQLEQQERQARQQEQRSRPRVIVSRPYFSPHYRWHQAYNRAPANPYWSTNLQFQHRGDHHRFKAHIGNTNRPRPPNFWR